MDAENDKGASIVLNSTSEFCRTLGDIPTYGQSGNREEIERDELKVGQADTVYSHGVTYECYS